MFILPDYLCGKPMRMPLKKIALLLAALGLTAAACAQKLKGSDTLLPLAQKAAENYSEKNPSAHVTVTGGGSGVGLSSLREGTTDIAMASRRIKFDERVRMQQAGRPVEELTVAFDALAVIVHPSNPVSRLTREQLEGIFRGKITNWKQVGGEDRKIVVYSRETSSGTYEFFKESVLKHRNYMPAVLSMPATGAIIQSVSQTPGAIGYVGPVSYTHLPVMIVHISRVAPRRPNGERSPHADDRIGADDIGLQLPFAEQRIGYSMVQRVHAFMNAHGMPAGGRHLVPDHQEVTVKSLSGYGIAQNPHRLTPRHAQPRHQNLRVIPRTGTRGDSGKNQRKHRRSPKRKGSFHRFRRISRFVESRSIRRAHRFRFPPPANRAGTTKAWRTTSKRETHPVESGGQLHSIYNLIPVYI